MLASRELMGAIAAPSWYNIIRVRPIAEVKVGGHVRTTLFSFLACFLSWNAHHFVVHPPS